MCTHTHTHAIKSKWDHLWPLHFPASLDATNTHTHTPTQALDVCRACKIYCLLHSPLCQCWDNVREKGEGGTARKREVEMLREKGRERRPNAGGWHSDSLGDKEREKRVKLTMGLGNRKKDRPSLENRQQNSERVRNQREMASSTTSDKKTFDCPFSPSGVESKPPITVYFPHGRRGIGAHTRVKWKTELGSGYLHFPW